ncbi:MAG: diguanylate cyclase [Sporolactobacillus sp.]
MKGLGFQLLKYVRTTLDRASLYQAILGTMLGMTILVVAVVYSQTAIYANRVKKQAACQISEMSTAQLFKQIDNYMNQSVYVDRLNIGMARSGALDVNNQHQMGRFFLNEVVSGRAVDYAYYANAAGAIVSSGHTGSAYTISATKTMQGGPFQIDRVSQTGRLRQKVVKTIAFDPRQRSWYRMAARTQKTFVSKAYGGVSANTLAITFAQPYVDARHHVLGVFGTDVLLNKIQNYVHSLQLTAHSAAYLAEADGHLIASSDKKQRLFTYSNRNYHRVSANQSSQPLIRQSWEKIQSIGFHNAMGAPIPMTINGSDYYLSVKEYTYHHHVKWYSVSMIAVNDLNQSLTVMNRRLIFLLLVTLILATIVIAWLARWILNPIKELNKRVKAANNGQTGALITTNRADELGQLSLEFNHMSLAMQRTYRDLLTKNKELEHLNSHLEELVDKRTRQLSFLARHDDLTGLLNHRAIIEQLNEKLQFMKAASESLSVVIFDIDHFKRYNDTFGHLFGNQILREVGALLKRQTDVICGRYGGEELLLIFTQMDSQSVCTRAEQIRKEISAASIREGEDTRLTLSGGISTYQQGDTIKRLIGRADQALYQAKALGRDQIVQANDAMLTDS